MLVFKFHSNLNSNNAVKMKKYIRFILFTGLLGIYCSCGDYLDVVPDNVATIDDAFADRTSAERYLATCYYFIPNFGMLGDIALLGSDEYWAIEDSWYGVDTYYGLRIQKGYQNANNPYFNHWDGLLGGRGTFQGIRECNTFLENILHVGGDLSDEEALRWAAEVKVLKAYYHYYLLRMYGPIPLQKENLSVSAGIEEVRVYRNPFNDCVDYIESLIDEAIPYLISENRVNSEYGRINRQIALSIKAEMLVMAASPLFNGNPDYASVVDNRGTHLFSTQYDATKWQKAATACKDAIDACHLGGHKLYSYTGLTGISDSTRLVTTLRHVMTDSWNDEIIWSEPKLTMFMDFGLDPFALDPILCPTLRMVESFYSNQGVPIDEDKNFDYAKRFTPVQAPEDHFYYIETGYETAGININREPRFYANFGFDGGKWFGNGRFQDAGQGPANEQPYVFQTKRGEARGKKSNLRYAMSGYWAKKPNNFANTVNSNGTVVRVRSTFPIFRLADLYLLYAEALNESLEAPNAEVYQYIDSVRNRAGIEGVVNSWRQASKFPEKPASKEGLREIIHTERMIELAFESKRYWDIRRWKTAASWINKPVEGLNVDGYTATEFNMVRTIFNTKFNTRDYLSPIREYNLRQNPNLVQNPGW
jgi:hypothetical protein